MLVFLAVIAAYLIGSVCSAIIVSQLCGLPDPRAEGSKNPGATNVLRLAGTKYAIIVLVADMLKGLIPVLIAKFFGVSPHWLGWIAFATVFGHMYPVFFRFQGGKGVATALGAFLGLNFILGVATLTIWLLMARFFRYSSLASVTAALFALLYSFSAFSGTHVFLPMLCIFIFILFKHHQNLTRLYDGNEPKIDLKLRRPRHTKSKT